jgi:hypothetical protein
MPKLSTLKPFHIAYCDNTLRDRGMIAPNKAILAAIVLTNPRLTSLLVRLYHENETDFTGLPAMLDTMEREYLLDTVAQHYTGQHWPANAASQGEMEFFKHQMLERASECGWVFE